MTITAINPYLSSNFAPVHEECTANDLEIIGELPPNLSGMFIQNGPNPQFSPIGRYHFFDGDGMVHAVLFSNGKAQYRNRYVRTKAWEMEREAGHAIWTGCMEALQMNNLPPSRFSVFKNTANTTTVWHAGQLLAMCEGQEPYVLTVPNLETVGPYTYNNKLAHPLCAHPKVDPITREMMVMGYSIWQRPYVKYSIVSATGELESTVPIEIPRPVMMHDFAITENYTIIMDLPLTINTSAQGLSSGEPLHTFRKDIPSRFGILPRHGNNDNIRWFMGASAFYISHTLNAYEEGDEVVLIAARVDRMAISQEVGTPLFNGGLPQLYRWRLNLLTGGWQEEKLDDVPAEYPAVNAQRLGRKTQYGYLSRLATEQVFGFNGVIKYDFSSGTSQTHKFGPRCYGSEPAFAPRLNSTTEDDGWLLTFVHNEDSGTSELLVLDAQKMKDQPVARVLIPQRVPYGIHCTWIPEDNLQRSQIQA